MSATVHRTPKSGGRQSLFYQDLATPVSSRRSGGRLSSPGQAAAVSALWRENISSTDLPPPPVFTLEDRSDFSPESGIPDYPVSPDGKSDPRTPVQGLVRGLSSPKSKSEASTSYAVMGRQHQPQSPRSSVMTSSWWSSAKSGGTAGQDDEGKGSPVEGVVQPGALITLPQSMEMSIPEMKKNSIPKRNLNEEEWVTVFGFLHADTNLVLREFEKCGVIVKHNPGPREANWMHILYQNRSDAQKALWKNGMQISEVLIIGVKPVDPLQCQMLNERLKNQEFMPLPPPASSSKNPESNGFKVSRYQDYLPNGSSSTRHSTASIATPAKSVVSKFVDLIFGV